MLEANAADLISRDGRIFVKGAEGKAVTVSDVARARLFRHNGAPIVGSGSFDADSVLPDSTRFGNESGAYNYGVQAAQVHVDPQTGQDKSVTEKYVREHLEIGIDSLIELRDSGESVKHLRFA